MDVSQIVFILTDNHFIVIDLFSLYMQKRNFWTPPEDQILIHLRQDRRISKWSEVAAIMELEYAIKNRSGKQCRDRYINKFSKNLSQAEWTETEENLLIQMYTQHGSRWSMMTQVLRGRTQNSIKNHFYSKLRKSVRKVNKIISKHFCWQYSNIRSQLLNDLMLISNQKLNVSETYNQQTINKGKKIVQFLYSIAEINPIHQKQQQKVRKVLEHLAELGALSKLTQPSSNKLFSRQNIKPYIKQEQDQSMSPFVKQQDTVNYYYLYYF